MRPDAPDELYNVLNNGMALISRAETDRIVRVYGSFLQYDATLPTGSMKTVGCWPPSRPFSSSF